MKTVPTFYEDALQPTVKELGKFGARVVRAINAAFSGVDNWILNKEYAIEETKKLLAQKLENVAPEKIVEPEPYIAIPTIQAISYSMNSEDLRNLYANLLANAMNVDTKDFVHPAYVNIINQMTPLDAKVLQTIFQEPDTDIPIVDLLAYRLIPNEGIESYTVLQSNITALDISTIEFISLSIENLSRNNLLHIDNAEYTNGYDSIYNSLQYKNFYSFHKNNVPSPYEDIRPRQKVCFLTSFGKEFCKICI